MQKKKRNQMREERNHETVENRRGQLQGLPIIRRRIAGIDLGSEQHWVCAPTPDGNGREIADFGATTPELIRMAQWLKERQVESVAMESTGVYWIAPHEILEAQGFQVFLVDTRQLARVPGRDKKTDPSDCEWIQRLHSCGLLRGSFRPQEQICMLRTLVRDKASLVARVGRLVAEDAKKSGSDECASAPGRRRSWWCHRNSYPARHCGRREGCPETRATSRSTLPQKRGANRRTIEWALAGRPLVQPDASFKDV
jgi:hypothetical protein